MARYPSRSGRGVVVVKLFFSEYDFYYTQPVIDAGIVPEQPVEEFRIGYDEWLEAPSEELGWLHNVPLYSNQEVYVSEDIFTRDVRVRIRYRTPCITSLKEAS